MDELKGEISGLAVEIASKVAEKEIGEKQHEALIEQVLSTNWVKDHDRAKLPMTYGGALYDLAREESLEPERANPRASFGAFSRPCSGKIRTIAGC